MSQPDPAPARSCRAKLADPGWQYVEALSLETFTADDWAVMNRQRAEFAANQQASAILAMLEAGAAEPSFGYQINNYRHCLLSATRVLQAGFDEETVVVALLHDIGFTACPATHGDFAASLLQPWIGARNHWMLEHHQIFQDVHTPTHPDADPARRECFRGHPHFAWTAEYVARFDQDAIDPNEAVLELAAFAPLVRRVFAKPPAARPNALWRSG